MKIELHIPSMRTAEIKGTDYGESGGIGLMHWKAHKRILIQMLYFVVQLYFFLWWCLHVCIFLRNTLAFPKGQKINLKYRKRVST